MLGVVKAAPQARPKTTWLSLACICLKAHETTDLISLKLLPSCWMSAWSTASSSDAAIYSVLGTTLQHLSALPVPLLRQVPLLAFFGCLFLVSFLVFFLCAFWVPKGVQKGPQNGPKSIKKRFRNGTWKGYQKSFQNDDFHDPQMWLK